MSEPAVERWKEDEVAFKKHFDLSYEDFCTLYTLLTPEQQAKYDRTQATNEEAAILWAIHEGKTHGHIKELGTG